MVTWTVNDKNYEIEEQFFYNDEGEMISSERKKELLAFAFDHDIPITNEVVGKIYNLEHRGGDRAIDYIENFHIRGSLNKMPLEVNEEDKEEISECFRNSNRFRGRVPRVIDSLTRVYTFFKSQLLPEGVFEESGITAEDFVSKFNINAMQTMLGAKVPETEAVLLYLRYDANQCTSFAGKIDAIENICSLIMRSYMDNNPALLTAADWIAEHTSTDVETLKKVKKNADRITIDKNATVESVETKVNNLKTESEIKKLEKVYKKAKFKFNKCKCDLKDVEKIVTHGRYNAYIMRGNDERQVILGYDSFCCQKLEDVGESAMMHGLLNPKAGFWIIEDKQSGQIKAQAEVWEENENTLVFDNIEFANDADIALYKGIINEWLSETSYQNCKMGAGYNSLRNRGSFRSCGGVMPTVTPYEIFVISHEQESEAPVLKSEKEAEELLQKGIDNNIPPFTLGNKDIGVTYYDYVYCDSERSAYWMKEDGIVETYFSGVINQRTGEQIFNNIKQRIFANNYNINNIDRFSEIITGALIADNLNIGMNAREITGELLTSVTQNLDNEPINENEYDDEGYDDEEYDDYDGPF